MPDVFLPCLNKDDGDANELLVLHQIFVSNKGLPSGRGGEGGGVRVPLFPKKKNTVSPLFPKIS